MGMQTIGIEKNKIPITVFFKRETIQKIEEIKKKERKEGKNTSRSQLIEQLTEKALEK